MSVYVRSIQLVVYSPVLLTRNIARWRRSAVLMLRLQLLQMLSSALTVSSLRKHIQYPLPLCCIFPEIRHVDRCRYLTSHFRTLPGHADSRCGSLGILTYRREMTCFIEANMLPYICMAGTMVGRRPGDADRKSMSLCSSRLCEMVKQIDWTRFDTKCSQVRFRDANVGQISHRLSTTQLSITFIVSIIPSQFLRPQSSFLVPG
jgi:hypothetical protein